MESTPMPVTGGAGEDLRLRTPRGRADLEAIAAALSRPVQPGVADFQFMTIDLPTFGSRGSFSVPQYAAHGQSQVGSSAHPAPAVASQDSASLLKAFLSGSSKGVTDDSLSSTRNPRASEPHPTITSAYPPSTTSSSGRYSPIMPSAPSAPKIGSQVALRRPTSSGRVLREASTSGGSPGIAHPLPQPACEPTSPPPPHTDPPHASPIHSSSYDAANALEASIHEEASKFLEDASSGHSSPIGASPGSPASSGHRILRGSSPVSITSPDSQFARPPVEPGAPVALPTGMATLDSLQYSQGGTLASLYGAVMQGSIDAFGPKVDTHHTSGRLSSASSDPLSASVFVSPCSTVTFTGTAQETDGFDNSLCVSFHPIDVLTSDVNRFGLGHDGNDVPGIAGFTSPDRRSRPPSSTAGASPGRLATFGSQMLQSIGSEAVAGGGAGESTPLTGAGAGSRSVGLPPASPRVVTAAAVAAAAASSSVTTSPSVFSPKVAPPGTTSPASPGHRPPRPSPVAAVGPAITPQAASHPPSQPLASPVTSQPVVATAPVPTPTSNSTQSSRPDPGTISPVLLQTAIVSPVQLASSHDVAVRSQQRRDALMHTLKELEGNLKEVGTRFKDLVATLKQANLAVVPADLVQQLKDTLQVATRAVQAADGHVTGLAALVTANSPSVDTAISPADMSILAASRAVAAFEERLVVVARHIVFSTTAAGVAAAVSTRDLSDQGSSGSGRSGSRRRMRHRDSGSTRSRHSSHSRRRDRERHRHRDRDASSYSRDELRGEEYDRAASPVAVIKRGRVP